MISFPVLARSRFDLHTEMIQRCALGPRVIPPTVTTIPVVAFGFQTKLKQQKYTEKQVNRIMNIQN